MLRSPGIVTEDENKSGKVLWIEFPDFPEISGTQGDNMDELITLAKDCLGGYLNYC